MIRATGAAILISIIAVGMPFFAALYVVTTRPDWVLEWVGQPASARAAQVSAVFLLLVLVGALVSVWTGRRTTGRVLAAMRALTERAERFGAGEAQLSPLDTGIEEMDRISQVLSRSALQSSRALATERGFAADASHQLRTPLTSLVMRIEEIAATDDREVAHEEAAFALAQVERLSRVVEELLQRTRSRGGGGAVPDVSLDSIIATLQREWQPAFETARRSVRVHGERGLVVRATPVALSQVLSTLLENSLVHGRGTVQVSARRSGPSVVVEVCDEGDGVSTTLAPHIFERSVTSGQTGTGLGLALARDLAESCGGRLELVARQPATFGLFLSEADTTARRADEQVR